MIFIAKIGRMPLMKPYSSFGGLYRLKLEARKMKTSEMTDWHSNSSTGTGKMFSTALLRSVTARAVVMWKPTVAATVDLEGDASGILMLSRISKGFWTKSPVSTELES
jgi:hypothetical protein